MHANCTLVLCVVDDVTVTGLFLLYSRSFYTCRALEDACNAISLKPDWPKGYYRKGRALAGLKVGKTVTSISLHHAFFKKNFVVL